MITRRQLLALSGGLLVPSSALAAPEGDERLFLFVFCAGGWDQHAVFAPLFGSEAVDMESGAVAASIGDIDFVDHEDRPAVRQFFEDHGDRTCILNGFEVQAIAHERCTELVHTARGVGWDDWAVAIAGRSSDSPLLPHLVISGPAYGGEYAHASVRVGGNGQLPGLLDRSVLDRSTLPANIPAGESAQDALVLARAEAALGRSKPGNEAFLERYITALNTAESLEERADLLSIPRSEEGFIDLVDQLEVALRAFEAGESRCATVQYDGIWAVGWDTHADNWYQSLHFQELFAYLSELAEQLESRSDQSGAPLSERVTVVVYSEMGRDPRMNTWDGRHHWTSTSAVLFGAGVAGGRSIGGFDEQGKSSPIDRSSGAVSDSGELLTSADFGATLLALADIDPEDVLAGSQPVDAAIG